MSVIYGNPSGGFGYPKTFILTDDNGNELIGVVTGQKQIFTATAANDIRLGKVAATDEGIVTGSKIFPVYTVWTGKKIVKSGDDFKIVIDSLDGYDYTEMQCIICPFNSSVDNSTNAEKVMIGNNIYNVGSTDIVSTVVKNAEDKSVDFNFTNTSDVIYIIRYYSYKEIE